VWDGQKPVHYIQPPPLGKCSIKAAMPQAVAEGGDYDTTQRLGNSSQRIGSNNAPPTNYPTYLGTTYFPTLPWPTFSPTHTKDSSSTGREPRQKHQVKPESHQNELNSSMLHLTSLPSPRPTPKPSSTLPTSKSPRPTSKPTSTRPSSTPSNKSMGSEVVSEPSSTNESASGSFREEGSRSSRQYGDRTSWSMSRQEPVDQTRSPSASEVQDVIEEVSIRELPTGVPTLNALSSDSSPRGWSSSRGQPYSTRQTPDPTVTATSHYDSPDSSPRWSGSSRSQPLSREHTPDPTVFKEPFPTFELIDTLQPTSSPTGELEEEDEGSEEETPSQSSNDTQYEDDTERNNDKGHDKTVKLHLTFEVDVVPSPPPTNADSDANVSLNFYEKGKDGDKDASVSTISPLTTEPTYFVYPTATPTEAAKGTALSSLTDEPSYVYPTPAPTEAMKDIPLSSYYPTFMLTYIPTYMPTNPLFEKQDRVGDDLTSSMFDKRICSGYPLGVDPLAPQKEEEVFFAYGVQTNVEAGDSIENSVERIQLLILEDVAHQLLLCPNDDSSISGRLLKNEKDGQFEQSVSRVYYMEDIAVATLSKILGSFSLFVITRFYLTVACLCLFSI
jgi:hypothetical protein